MTLRLGVLASHPIQYQAPLFRELARHVDLKVYFAHRQTAAGQAAAGFNVAFEWDVDLLAGYDHTFLTNRASRPDVNTFFGCDTPEIADEIRTGQFDAFLVTGWYLKSFWQAIRACRRAGVPVMVRGDSQLGTPRGRLKPLVKELIYPRLLRQFDACLYVGQKNREYLEHYGVPADRLFFAPHCIDNEAFTSRAQGVDRAASRGRFGIAPEQKAVLFVGKLLDRKRPFDLVAALRTLRQRGMNACGVFAGDGPLRASLEEKGREWDVSLVFLGFRNQTELPEAYASADVMALPSEGSETWGLVVNEALASGTPVVVSDAVGCAPDLALEGQTGSVYPVGDTLAFADALQRVLEAPPPPEAIHKAIDAYSVPAAARGILDALSHLARGTRA
jgi:glycosyltransferase involved in cell wall biosynthesis